MSMPLKILAVNLTKLFYRDKIYKTYSLNGNGDPFGALVEERSFHYSDQFAIHDFEGGSLLPLDTVLTDDICGDRWTRGDLLLALEGRFQDQTA